MRQIERGPFFEDFQPEQVLGHPSEIQLTRDIFQELVRRLEFDDQLIHVDPEYARAEGYRDIILPGPIVYALVFRLSRRQVSWSGLNVRTDSMVHKYPVYPDDTLEQIQELYPLENGGDQGARLTVWSHFKLKA